VDDVTEARQEIAEIRTLIKDFVPTLSVRNSRGTGWGWIHIRGSLSSGYFTDDEAAGLEALGFNHGANFCVIGPDEHGHWLEKLRQLHHEMRQTGLTPVEHLQKLVEASRSA
jgi:hypothetical protein